MIVDKPLEEVEGREPARLPVTASSAVYAAVMSVAILVLGVAWNPLSEGSYQGVKQFHDVPVQGVQHVAQKELP
jgi:hypothetical protein